MRRQMTSLWPFCGFPCSAGDGSEPDAELPGPALDAAGDPVSASHEMTFRLYTEAEVGPVWTEAHDSVDIIDGRFTVELGEIEALPPN